MGGYLYLDTEYALAVPHIRELYLKNLYRKEGFYPYRDSQGEFLAKFHDVEPNGYLILTDEEGTLRRYAFKEVEFILP